VKHRILTLIAAVAASLLIGSGVAMATTPAGSFPVESDCVSGWYANPDEKDLLPKQTPEGILFDGPSLMHRAVTPMGLATAPGGQLTTAGSVTGSKPLVKFETSAPYSTINVTGSGSVWSSKIPADQDGGQSKPVEHLSELVGKGPYTADTKVVTVGAGYASDTGNKATVSAIAWNGTVWDLTCKTKPEPSKTTSSPAAPKDCAAYVYTGTKQTLCADLGNAEKLTCKQAKFRVTLVDKATDPWGLDGSGGGTRGVVGLGCESNPLKPQPSATSKTSSIPAAAVTTTQAPATGAGLPVTGPSAGDWIAIGMGVVIVGLGLWALGIVLVRRRKVRWQA
jgi:hypothetical protein